MAYGLIAASVLTGSLDVGLGSADSVPLLVVLLLSPLGAVMFPWTLLSVFVLIFLAASAIVRRWKGDALQLRWPWMISGALLGGLVAATLDPLVAKSAGLVGREVLIVAVGALTGAATMLLCRNELRRVAS
jgi:hypothetical protein